jgi:hypothetical protein
MIDKFTFAPKMNKTVYSVQADEKVRLKLFCEKGETTVQYALRQNDTTPFVPAFVFVDETTTIVSVKFQQAGDIYINNIGEFNVTIEVYSGSSYGNA